ncbi:O-antigen ligase [Granulicella sp. S190]|uniref:O-antigen ligase family protein n=1 Tax=Granulicella sp. S190 TaxID=1747226 RepID=UPI00131DDC6B|nr:O-antigen ligase family protein [Granulicella sp. S190]
MGLGLAHFVPMIAYLGFWVMCIVSLTGRPLLGFYYVIPFLPYRTMRDHFLDYPLGSNVLTILVLAVIIGALIHGKRLPKTKLYVIWLVFSVYLYFSMWLGVMLGNATAPLWLNDANFVTWKDYMMMPLTFVAAGLVVDNRKAVRTVIMIAAFTLLAIDRSCLMDSMSRTWTTFDENKRNGGPLGFNSNETAAFLAQFGMFFWGFGQYLKRKKIRLIAYGLAGITLFACMYTFSRGAYLAIILSMFVLGLLKDRKLLIIGTVFLLTWQTVVPTAVRQRVQMTHSANGQLESSANERVELWEAAEASILSNPVFGTGFASYQMKAHVDGLRDTHNWYVKVMVETGVIGMIIVIIMIQQMMSIAYRAFRRAEDPLYKGLGLGVFIAICSCVVANCFGDRWTYLEINGMLWVLIAAAARTLELSETAPATEPVVAAVSVSNNPYLAYR